MESSIHIQAATPADLSALLDLRLQMFEEMGIAGDAAAQAHLRQISETFFAQGMASGQCSSWLAVTAEGRGVACGSVALFSRPPYPGNLQGLEAYLLNMYTHPDWRKLGLARRILHAAQAHARAKGCAKMWLMASEMGQALYAENGFVEKAGYMEWELFES